ncbi:hypothetical protein NDU88_001555 [Pleurodeles waltl]|uniref:Uncharacterized protein n=1 Tax=Pleurodeles waltl TaxID=8319 RepID=A0AAV7S917_PLEWA|nr:hypothetical protein NDU88_001555 [Pleurodeles waltl]
MRGRGEGSRMAGCGTPSAAGRIAGGAPEVDGRAQWRSGDRAGGPVPRITSAAPGGRLAHIARPPPPRHAPWRWRLRSGGTAGRPVLEEQHKEARRGRAANRRCSRPAAAPPGSALNYRWTAGQREHRSGKQAAVGGTQGRE